MIGNLRGWLYSAVIIAFTAALIYWKGTPEAISPPLGQLPRGLVSVAFQTDPRLMLASGAGDCDAGDFYRQAAEQLRVSAKQIQGFAYPKDRAAKMRFAGELEPMLDLLARASDCGRMNLFLKKPEEIVNYEIHKPLLRDLQQIGQIAVNVGAMYIIPGTSGKPKGAIKGARYLTAAFHLGRNLYEERLVFEEFQIGSEIIGNSAAQLAKHVEKDPSRIMQLENVAKDANLQKYTALWAGISGIAEEGKQIASPGDLLDIARNSREPMWQTEALLKAGRMRYMAGVRYGDQRGAEQVLWDVSRRTDLPPNVRAAAVAGRDLTLEQFRMFGGG